MFFGTGATRSSIQAAGCVRRGFQRIAKRARRRGHDEGADASARRLLEQDQRAENIGLDEGLTRMGRDMRLVQRRGMEDRIDALHGARDQGAVGDRADLVGERSGNDVEADRRAAIRAQTAHQGFAEMPRTAGDEHGHCCDDPGPIPLAF